MYQDKWEVDSDGGFGTFFYAITAGKYVEDDRDNTVSVG